MKKQISVLTVLLAASMTVQAGGAVVVAKDSPISSMSAEDVKDVFLGRKAFVSGQPMVVVFQKEGTPTRSDFETKVVGKTGAELSQYVSKQIFTGKAAPPIIANDDAAVRAKVAGTPGAIGYVSGQGVDSTVKVIFKY
jgi:ABC-type phosphate transport system substrate-binding protein